MNKLIIIQGTTASGKSSLAVDLALELGCSIVSADSRQFYREMSKGTAKPSQDEMKGVSHYFVDSHSIYENTLSSADFMRLGRQKIDELFRDGAQNIIVTGGSGMFIDALVEGLHPSPQNSEVRDQLQIEWKKKGITPLLEELKMRDAESYNNMDINNPVRILRALEVIRVSGQTLSEIRTQPKEKIPHATTRFCVSWERKDLYNRINIRVDQMMNDGLFDEIMNLPVQDNLLLKNTVGYKEWLLHFDGGQSKEEVVELIKKNTRNYAKRQETWLKRYSDLIALNPYDKKTLKDQLLTHLNA
jgi:tRNA dimethylallyltransferase